MSLAALSVFLAELIEIQRSACAQFTWLARGAAIVSVLTLAVAILKAVFAPASPVAEGMMGLIARGESIIGALSVFFGAVAGWPTWQLPKKRARLAGLRVVQAELATLSAAGEVPRERLDALYAYANNLLGDALRE